MRGEEIRAISAGLGITELPPHARRRVSMQRIIACFFGITSACAEKRVVGFLRVKAGRNYLRMRGEELEYQPKMVGPWELPPHARRRAETWPSEWVTAGITSACAEKSRGP